MGAEFWWENPLEDRGGEYASKDSGLQGMGVHGTVQWQAVVLMV